MSFLQLKEAVLGRSSGYDGDKKAAVGLENPTPHQIKDQEIEKKSPDYFRTKADLPASKNKANSDDVKHEEKS